MLLCHLPAKLQSRIDGEVCDGRKGSRSASMAFSTRVNANLDANSRDINVLT